MNLIGLRIQFFADSDTYLRCTNTVVAFPLTLFIFVFFKNKNYTAK